MNPTKAHGIGLRTRDLIRLRSHDLTIKKLEVESRDELEDDQQALRLMFEILQSSAPRMKPINTSPEQLAAQEVLMRARLDSQQLANSMPVRNGAVGDGGEAKLTAIEARLKG